jgi:hypothetical protein
LRKRRIWFFLLTIIIGISAGLVYGWVINPLNHAVVTPRSLRMDYKTDYVLMVAENYYANQDASQAASELAFMGAKDTSSLVEQAVNYSTQIGYTTDDITRMDQLFIALKNSTGVR